MSRKGLGYFLYGQTVDHDFLLSCDCQPREVFAPILGISYSHRKVFEFLAKRGDIICLSADQYC